MMLRCILLAEKLVLFGLALAVQMAAQSAASLSAAEAFIRQGQWDQGISILVPLLKSGSANTKVANLLGIAYMGKGDTQSAAANFRLALKVSPAFYPARKNLAIVEFNQGQYNASKRDLLVVLKQVPDDPAAHLYLGQIEYLAKNYRAALSNFQQSQVLVDQDAAAGLQLVDCYLNLGMEGQAATAAGRIDPNLLDVRTQFEAGYRLASRELYREALPFFEAVRRRQPDSSDAGFNVAICLMESEQFDGAIEVLRAMADAGAMNPESLSLLAEAYAKRERIQEAIEVLRKATQLFPTDENAYLELANLCVDHNSQELALDVASAGIHFIPASARLYLLRGVVKAMSSRFDEANQDFEAANRLDPAAKAAYAGIGLTYIQRGDNLEAVRVLRAEIKKRPDNYLALFLMGEAILRSGAGPADPAFVEAKSALELSVRVNPRYALSRIDLAKVYLAENRVEEAIQHLEAARALDPKEKSAYAQLAIAYRKKGETPKAREMLQIVMKLNMQARADIYVEKVRLIRQDTK